MAGGGGAGGGGAGERETWMERVRAEWEGGGYEEEEDDWWGGNDRDSPSFWAPASYSNQEELKQQIGCKLYTLVAATHPEQAGKIVGMLLEGLFESNRAELVRLINRPVELDGWIQQCVEALLAANQRRESAINLLPKHVESILMKEAERLRMNILLRGCYSENNFC